MEKLIIWGSTGHAIVLSDFISILGYSLIALFDNNRNVKSIFNTTPLFYGIQGFNEWKKSNTDTRVNGLVAIGGNKGKDRREIQSFFEINGIHIISAIHPRAFVSSSAEIGKGSQILANAVVCARSKLGDATIINTSATVDHECILGAGVHIGPGACLAGCVAVGENSFIGTGATVLPRLCIGNNCIIGAGAVVTKNIPDNVVAYGNPAKIKKNIG